MPSPDAECPQGPPHPVEVVSHLAMPLDDLKRTRLQLINTLARDGAVDPRVIETIGQRIQQLSVAIGVLQDAEKEAKESAQKDSKRKSGIGAIVIVLFITGTLLLLPRPSAVVSVETRSTSLKFTLSSSHPKEVALFESIEGIQSILISGLSRISEDGVELATTNEVHGLQLRIESACPKGANKIGETGSKHSIGLSSLTLPDNTPVQLSADGAHQLSARLDRPPAKIKVAVGGCALVTVAGQEPAPVNATQPVQFEGVPTTDAPVILTIIFDAREAVFETPVSVQGIGWDRDVRDYSGDPKSPLEQSSITSGKISLKEFKDRTVVLNAGEYPVSDMGLATIRGLSSDGSGIHCLYDATPHKLLVRDGEVVRNLMPTWLAWLRERDDIVQFWTVFAYICGLGFAAMQWWREPK
jgi:hypothetical protein